MKKKKVVEETVGETIEEVVEPPITSDTTVVPETPVAPEISVVPKVDDSLTRSIIYIKSYLARLTLSNKQVLDNYNQVKNILLAYKNKSVITWDNETFVKGNKELAKVDVIDDILKLYISLSVEEIDQSLYSVINVSDIEGNENTPTLIDINSFDDLVKAFELIQIMMAKLKITRRDIPQENYRPVIRTFDELVEKELIVKED